MRSRCAEEAVKRIAEPIEEQYTTADQGRKLVSNRDKSHEGYSTEGYLWDLYYGILHAARRIPWEDAQQEKLLELMKTLKARPDPEPAFKTMEVEPDWVLSEGRLWSRLIMLGPSSRESWNDTPGGGAGMEDPELKAWTNVNAFVARMTRDGVYNYWKFCTWAMRDAFDTEFKAKEKETRMLDAFVPTAAVWVLILGKQLFDRESEPVEESRWEKVGRKMKVVRKQWEPDFSKKRWQAWKQRFGELAEQGMLAAHTRAIAQQAYQSMQRLMTMHSRGSIAST